MKKYLYLGLFWALAPAGVAADSPRSIYGISTVAGSASLGDGGPAIDAQIGAIQGIAADSSGNLYLSDTDHNCVRKIDSTGVITTMAGTGAAGFSGDGGPATSAQLNSPYGLAIDANGNLYIADLSNNRVRRVSPNGTIATYAGSNGAGSSGDGGPATSAQMLAPRNLALDSAGDLYISEFGGNRVRKVTPEGLISTAAGTGIGGYSGDGGPATAAQLFYPAGLALDRYGNLYIADSMNSRVRKVLPGGQISSLVGPNGPSSLQMPAAVAVDLAGDLYVGDQPMVQEFTTAGEWVIAAGNFEPGFYGDGGLATAAFLTAVRDLTVDLDGNLYIADLNRIREVNSHGIIHTVAGADYLYAIGDGASATAANLLLPSTVALDTAGNLYIADTGTNRVRQVSSSGTITTVAGTGVESPGGEATIATATTLFIPTGVAVDQFGNLLIVETGANRIRQVSADGRIRTIVGSGQAGLETELLQPTQIQLSSPRGICLDRTGNLYVVDSGNQRVLLVSPEGLVTTAAGNGVPGDGGDGGFASLAQLDGPTACAADSAGNLYIADTYNHRIRKVDATGAITTVAGVGVAGDEGNEGPATSARLNGPLGVAADDSGDIYISDSGNNAIRQVTPDGVIHLIAGTGPVGFGGDGGPALAALLNAPGGILLDGSGDLFFADTENDRVRELVATGEVAGPAVIPPPTPLWVANAASQSTGSIAPGEVVSIFGSDMGPETGVGALIDPGSLLATQLAGVQVLFDGVPAPLFYAQANQVNAQAPYTVAGQASTNIEVLYQGGLVNATAVAVASSAPGVFPTAINQDGTYNSGSNPASSGAYLTIYATGEGLTNGANISGQPAGAPYPQPELLVTASIGGVTAQIVWAGSAPGLVGLLQVNLLIPGPYLPSGAAQLQLTVGAASSPVMTIWVQ